MKLYEPNIPSSQTDKLKWKDFECSEDIPNNKPILIESENNETQEKSQFMVLGAPNPEFHENNTILRFSQLTTKMAKTMRKRPQPSNDAQIEMF